MRALVRRIDGQMVAEAAPERCDQPVALTENAFMPTTEIAKERLKIFISYSLTDLVTANALVVALEAADFTVMIDRRDLPYGEKWQEVLFEFIRDSDTVLFLVSERSVHSQWVRWELQQVTELRKRLMPVVLTPCSPESLPPAIASVEVLPRQGVFIFERHIAHLIEALNTNRAWVMEATKLQSRTLDWINAGKAGALLLPAAALDRAESWRAVKPNVETISGDILDFLLSSRQQANRRQRYWVIGSLVIAIGASILTAIAYQQSIEATRQSNAAVAQSAALTSLSSDNDPSRGLLLAQEALRRSQGNPTVTTVAAHRNAVHRFGPTPLLEAGRRGLPIAEVNNAYALFQEEAATALEVSDNGRWLVVGIQYKGTRELWRVDLEHKDPASTFRVIDSGLIDDISSISSDNTLSTFAISNSGRFVAVAPGKGSRSGPGVYVFDLRESETHFAHLAKWSGERPDYAALRFSDDERYLANGNHLWRLDEAAHELDPKLLPGTPRSASPFFSPDSTRVRLARREADEIQVDTWIAAQVEYERRETFSSLATAISAYPNLSIEQDRESQDHLNVSPDGRWEISWNEITGSPPVIRHYDGAGGPTIETIFPVEGKGDELENADSDKAPVKSAAFSKNGKWLATIGRTLQLWDLSLANPFNKPRLDFSTPGLLVAIDPSGRWLASFGKRLQIWDLALDAPIAFPIEPKSIFNNTGMDVRSDDIKLRFAASGAWLVVESSRIRWTAEFWNLDFDNAKWDASLARRNLSVAEWRSFFGDASYRKTFPDQPIDAEPMVAADAIAQAGKVLEAIEAYEHIAAAETGLKLDPKGRALLLASQFYWQKGEDAAIDGKYETALQLLRQAKDMNPAIPWIAEARAGQLWARNWSEIISQLGGHSDKRFDQPDVRPGDADGLLAQLRNVLQRYPNLQFDAHEITLAAERDESLYEFGLRTLADRTNAVASKGDLEEALRLRAILVREAWSGAPTEERLRELRTGYWRDEFQNYVASYEFVNAEKLVSQVDAANPPLAANMRPILDLVENFREFDKMKGAGTQQASAQFQKFRGLAENIPSLELIPPETLNQICWSGTTQFGLARIVLPMCEAAVARARSIERWKSKEPGYLDSRGVAYAVLGLFDSAISDFQEYLARGYPDGSQVEARRKWIVALKACKLGRKRCQNPLADATYLQSIR